MMKQDGVKIEEIEFQQQWRTDCAMEVVKEFKPDVVLLDYYIPPFTGLTVLKQLNSAIAEGTVPRPRLIVAMSSQTRCNKEMLSDGADLALLKPRDLVSWSFWPR